MKKFQKPSNYFHLGRAAEPPYRANQLNTQSRNLVKPSYTKTPTKEHPELGNHNQYSEPPGNPPYTAIYQYNETPPTLHHSS